MPIVIEPGLVIADDEVTWTASRSGGPGGQNVNKVNSRVTLRFDLAGSRSLTAVQKERIAARLANRVAKDGSLRIVSQRHRTQPANLDAACERLADLLREALAEDAPRVATRPTSASRTRRLDEKTRRSRVKRERRTVDDD